MHMYRKQQMKKIAITKSKIHSNKTVKAGTVNSNYT